MTAPDWARQHCWRILDTSFELRRFLQCWQDWRTDSQRPQVLHYVALTQSIPELSRFGTEALAQELAAQCHSLEHGFQRISMEQGRVLLTLCVGERRGMLREQQFAADSVFLDAQQGAANWDRWDFKALTRCCRRGTTITCSDSTPALVQGLADSGFEMTGTGGKYQPRWEIKTTREPQRLSAAVPTSCVVIGAGLAGASVAASLARRGWQIDVYDSAGQPAAGASGLPAGLVVPHVSADDSPRSRLSRSGVRLTLQQVRDWLELGQDWEPSGVLERRLDGQPDLWHEQAGWVKPAQLVRQWLAQPGVRFHGNSEVLDLRRVDESWELLGAAGQCLGSARHVVLANALGAPALLMQLAKHQSSQPLLAPLPAMHGMRGAVSWGRQQPAQARALPAHPINGNGSLIPAVPVPGGRAWYTGATYEPATEDPAPDTTQHQTNLDKLRTLLPDAAAAIASGDMQLWQGVRCVSMDRMPLAGALQSGSQPNLWISAAMGSRGLSFAVLCAELLAARIGAEPLPVEGSLARFLDPGRRALAL